MLRLRRLLPLVLCFSFCLTICVLPVSAAKLDEYSGVIALETETFGMRENGLTDTTRWGWQSAPASFSLEKDTMYTGETYSFLWGMQTALTKVYSVVTGADKEITIIFNVGDGNGTVDVAFGEVDFRPYFLYISQSQVGDYLDFKMTGTFTFGVDGEDIYTSDVENDFFPYVEEWSGSVSRYFYLTYRTTEETVAVYDVSDALAIAQCIDIYCWGFTVNDEPASLDDISISIKNIEEDVEEIKNTVTNIEEGVADIESTVTDMSEQLQDSSSNIWQAAGETISNAVESLFVPSAEDITEVKQGFDDLAKDKLGGAYTAMETVDDTITQVNDKLNNPSVSEGIEFPGISVPLGGDVGTVTLAEPQLVVLPTKLTAVLHPVAGTIVSIICGLGTFNVLKDMVECFLSGYSFAEYLHRNKGRSDD